MPKVCLEEEEEPSLLPPRSPSLPPARQGDEDETREEEGSPSLPRPVVEEKPTLSFSE